MFYSYVKQIEIKLEAKHVCHGNGMDAIWDFRVTQSLWAIKDLYVYVGCTYVCVVNTLHI